MGESKRVYDFWFTELQPAQWFKKDLNLDRQILESFQDLHKKAAAGELSSWREEPRGALSEVILLDQFSRNIYREQALSFAFDPIALVLAQEAIRRGLDSELNTREKSFLYMPFMHSESLAVHQRSIELFSFPGMEGNLDFAQQHKKIIARFGRYPHRNKILGRESSDEELEFLNTPGSSF